MYISGSGLFMRTAVKMLGVFACAFVLHGCNGQSGEVEPGSFALTPELSELQVILDSELARLGVDPARSAAVAPGDGNSVIDLQVTATEVLPGGSASFELRWTERLIGDYDQNGFVNVSDLTPLAQHFNKTVSYRPLTETGGIRGWPAGAADDPQSADNWRLARIDGNMDGVINVSDVTPIAQHWQEDLAGYAVYVVRDGGEPEPLGDGAKDAPSIARPAVIDNMQPVSYLLADTVELPGSFSYFVVPVGNAGSGAGPASEPRVASFNLPPTALLEANVTTGLAPLTVNFDAAGSADPDGSISTYEYDFDNDGTFEAGQANVQHVFTDGEHTVVLRVTDDAGASATTELLLSVDDGLAVFSFDRSVKPAGSEFTLDGSGSLAGQPITNYTWDFDSDGIIDEQGPDPIASFSPPPGRGKVTMGIDGDDGPMAQYSSWYISYADGIVIIRTDEHEYPANLDALTSDLDSIPVDWTMIDYSDDLLTQAANSSSILYIWYRGGPGAGTEPMPYTRMWTTAEIDNYIGLLESERNVLLMSQAHGKDPDIGITANLWEIAQGMTLVDNTIPAAEHRHPWAASLCTDTGTGAELLGWYPTSPQNMSGFASLELHYDVDGASAASRYLGAGSSGKLAIKLEIAECLQLCGIGSNSAALGFPGGYGSGFLTGISTPLTSDQALSHLSYGNSAAPDGNMGFFPAYEHEYGSARLWVIGYPWAQMSVSQSPGEATQRHDVLHNIIAWLTVDDMP